MQEEADRLRDAEIAQLRAEREEMIVLHPERGVRLLEAQQRARHEGVDLAIADIIVLRSADQIGARMQRRPQRRIGEAFVIAAVMRRRQIEHRQRAGAQRLDFGERFLLVPVAHAAAGTDPDRAGFLDDRQQRRRQSRPSWARSALPRETRLETTTRFTGPLLLVRAFNSHSSIWFLINRFNELKPNSGCVAERNSRGTHEKKIHFANIAQREARECRVRDRRTKSGHDYGSACVPFVIEQMREELAHVARRIEMTGDAAARGGRPRMRGRRNRA